MPFELLEIPRSAIERRGASASQLRSQRGYSVTIWTIPFDRAPGYSRITESLIRPMHPLRRSRNSVREGSPIGKTR
jgi:hypothetical protein